MSKYLQQVKNICRYVEKEKGVMERKSHFLSCLSNVRWKQSMNITTDFGSNYRCGRRCSATFMNLNRERLFRNDRKLPDALCMAAQLPASPPTLVPVPNTTLSFQFLVEEAAVTLVPAL